jgi:Flp pilus assembly protein TadD
MTEPKDVSTQLARVEDLLRMGQLGAAENVAKALLQLAPRQARGWQLLGVIYLWAGAHAQAEAALREAVTLVPESGDCWNNLSVALYSKDRLAEAEGCARRAIQFDCFNAGRCQRRNRGCANYWR